MCSSGPGQYNLGVKSFPQMALFTSREERFKVSTNTNPGPGAYQVNMFKKKNIKNTLTSQHKLQSISC